MSPYQRNLLIVLVLGLTRCQCSFDPPPAFPPDAAVDAGFLMLDATLHDSGALFDAHLIDSGLLDSGGLDATFDDIGNLDAEVIDTGVPDAESADTGFLDATLPDAGGPNIQALLIQPQNQVLSGGPTQVLSFMIQVQADDTLPCLEFSYQWNASGNPQVGDALLFDGSNTIIARVGEPAGSLYEGEAFLSPGQVDIQFTPAKNLSAQPGTYSFQLQLSLSGVSQNDTLLVELIDGNCGYASQGVVQNFLE